MSNVEYDYDNMYKDENGEFWPSIKEQPAKPFVPWGPVKRAEPVKTPLEARTSDEERDLLEAEVEACAGVYQNPLSQASSYAKDRASRRVYKIMKEIHGDKETQHGNAVVSGRSARVGSEALPGRYVETTPVRQGINIDNRWMKYNKTEGK